MAGPARKRTAAQRKPKAEDEEPLKQDEILDEQAQDNEISRLRAKNNSDNAQAHNALDVGVLTCLFITVMQFIGHLSSPTPIFAIISLIQMILLPFTLSSHWFSFLPTVTPDTHLYIFSIQLTMSCCAVFLRWQHGDTAGAGAMAYIELNEVARWAMPALVVGAVDMQRRSERQAEEKLRLLEGLKYDLKGA